MWLGGLGWASRAVSIVSSTGRPPQWLAGELPGQVPWEHKVSDKGRPLPCPVKPLGLPGGEAGLGPQRLDGRPRSSGPGRAPAPCLELAVSLALAGRLCPVAAHLLTFKDGPGGRAGAGRRAPVPLLHTPGAALVEVAPTG